MSTLPVMERNKSMCLKPREKFTTNIYRGSVKCILSAVGKGATNKFGNLFPVAQ
jgi:hypothetical protein